MEHQHLPRQSFEFSGSPESGKNSGTSSHSSSTSAVVSRSNPAHYAPPPNHTSTTTTTTVLPPPIGVATTTAFKFHDLSPTTTTTTLPPVALVSGPVSTAAAASVPAVVPATMPNSHPNGSVIEASSQTVVTSANISSAATAGLTTLAYVRKLDGLFKSLEERVRRLEMAIVAGNINGVTGSALSLVAEGPSTSSAGAGTVHHPTGPAAGPVPVPLAMSSHAAAAYSRKISKSDLEDYCLPLLQRRATPSLGELNSLAMAMKTAKYHHLESRHILSKIREWFRRKREYMSQRVLNVCQRRFPPASLSADAVSSLLLAFVKNSVQSVALLKEVAKEANLEVIDEDSLMEFTHEKCIGYLENLQMTMRKYE